jgi:uncharacterized protein YqfA (UPF0365 family)
VSVTAAVKKMPNLAGVTNADIEVKAKCWLLHAQTRIKQFAKAKNNRASEFSEEN